MWVNQSANPQNKVQFISWWPLISGWAGFHYHTLTTLPVIGKFEKYFCILGWRWGGWVMPVPNHVRTNKSLLELTTWWNRDMIPLWLAGYPIYYVFACKADCIICGIYFFLSRMCAAPSLIDTNIPESSHPDTPHSNPMLSSDIITTPNLNRGMTFHFRNQRFFSHHLKSANTDSSRERLAA